MACLEEAVGSILSGVREVKIEITVIDGRRGEILVRGGQFFSGVYLGAPHESDSRGVLFHDAQDLCGLPRGDQRLCPADCVHSSHIYCDGSVSPQCD